MISPGKIPVCPQPMHWHELHQRLNEAAEANPGIPSPPKPLILGGWVATNDVEKLRRWQDTIAWAKAHGLSRFVDNVPDELMYSVSELSSYEVGPLGGPMYLAWTYDPKPEVSSAERIAAIQQLQSNWTLIAGGELANVTRPLRLTGEKGRRLLVLVTPDSIPPWGSWTTLAREEETRRTFTAFRAAVNQAVSPLEIDHIDFIETGLNSC